MDLELLESQYNLLNESIDKDTQKFIYDYIKGKVENEALMLYYSEILEEKGE